MCVSCDSCNSLVVMEGSSDSGWRRRSDNSSRGLNSSYSDRNPRILLARSTARLSGDSTSHDSVRKGRERTLLRPHIGGNHRTQVAGIDDSGGAHRPVECNDVSLRQWLDNPERTVDALECLHIFSQIVDVVNLAHSQGIVVQNIRPSCFIMSSLNRVSFIESASCSDSGSGSDSHEEYGSNDQIAGLGDLDCGIERNRAYAINSETSCLHSASGRVSEATTGNEKLGDKKHSFPMKQILVMESTWYRCPEEVSGAPTSCASDIYQLGVLLFELFCTFGSREEKGMTMSSLRHRVLPPQLLLKWPKEASFCLWLLHPDPSGRPKMSDLLQSEFLNEPRDDIEEREAAIELREKIEEQELLLEFLLTLQQKKQEAADTLNEVVSFISSDIEEVAKRHTSVRTKGGGSSSLVSCPRSTNIADDEDDDSGNSVSRKRIRQGICNSGPDESDQGSILSKNSRLMKNFRKLESAYFSNAELVSSMQKRHSQPNSKSRSEMFSSHPEEVASGFPIDPPRPSQSVEEEANNDCHGNSNTHKRASHSGPLVNRAAWSKSGRNMEDPPNSNLAIADLSAMSGLVAARRSMLSEDRREKSYSQHEVPKLISRFPGSFKEASNSLSGQDQRHNGQYEDDKASHNNPANLGKGSRGKKIHYSGPLLVPSGKVDQILKDHDRQIQEAVRRARLDKERMRKLQVEGSKISTNSLFVSGR